MNTHTHTEEQSRTPCEDTDIEENGHMKTEVEIRIVLSKAKGCYWKLEEVRKDPHLESSEGTTPGLPGLQNCERTHFCCFKLGGKMNSYAQRERY